MHATGNPCPLVQNSQENYTVSPITTSLGIYRGGERPGGYAVIGPGILLEDSPDTSIGDRPSSVAGFSAKSLCGILA